MDAVARLPVELGLRQGTTSRTLLRVGVPSDHGVVPSVGVASRPRVRTAAATVAARTVSLIDGAVVDALIRLDRRPTSLLTPDTLGARVVPCVATRRPVARRAAPPRFWRHVRLDNFARGRRRVLRSLRRRPPFHSRAPPGRVSDTSRPWFRLLEGRKHRGPRAADGVSSLPVPRRPSIRRPSPASAEQGVLVCRGTSSPSEESLDESDSDDDSDDESVRLMLSLRLMRGGSSRATRARPAAPRVSSVTVPRRARASASTRSASAFTAAASTPPSRRLISSLRRSRGGLLLPAALRLGLVLPTSFSRRGRRPRPRAAVSTPRHTEFSLGGPLLQSAPRRAPPAVTTAAPRPPLV